jgi:hypothetical protein
MAAPDVQHAWAFDAADCSGKDLVGNMDGKLMNGLTCDNDGLTLNFGNSASNGDQQHVDFGTYQAFGNEFSFAMWIKFKDEFPYHSRLFDIESSKTGDKIFYNSHTDTGQMTFQVYNTGTNIASDNVATTGIQFWTKDVWTHVVGTVDSNGDKQIFKNGVLMHTASGNAGVPNVDRDIFYLGRSAQSGEKYFKGWIRSAASWHRALKQEDVERLYELGKPTEAGDITQATSSAPIPQVGRESPLQRCRLPVPRDYHTLASHRVDDAVDPK